MTWYEPGEGMWECEWDLEETADVQADAKLVTPWQPATASEPEPAADEGPATPSRSAA
jgi:hypothetical protein